jgi:hypothetical protein
VHVRSASSAQEKDNEFLGVNLTNLCTDYHQATAKLGTERQEDGTSSTDAEQLRGQKAAPLAKDLTSNGYQSNQITYERP